MIAVTKEPSQGGVALDFFSPNLHSLQGWGITCQTHWNDLFQFFKDIFTSPMDSQERPDNHALSLAPSSLTGSHMTQPHGQLLEPGSSMLLGVKVAVFGKSHKGNTLTHPKFLFPSSESGSHCFLLPEEWINLSWFCL